MIEDKYEKRCFDLFLWQHGDDFFTCKLYSLIQKADMDNRNKLRQCFPVEVAVFEEWYNTATEEEFFMKWCPAHYQAKMGVQENEK